ncbi:MAG: gliding motility-associated ABC transporter substrate-binding protein GldG [Bacteroidetes bacterium]|nr:gliding motility-associated ABC transporter substrate-binding protein GldG [Bacteroidota bacterium]MBT4409860.1 gliding motility-associated ABC transporter substrate-binding protein GldG [Bacteroidota bacterium]MBT7095348.1 gliding motility-associated ABC transporter substrate-binding protein GldG [Bacteroidota bacterium]MBT7465050.1 gliding motility-associated ABC transporter substrate-binding protein GldG [Bacteroidota bacterium]
MKKKQVKTQNIIQLVLLLAVVILINLISHFVYHRFDLTEEKRYTLTPSTKNFLTEMTDVIYIKVYLEGKNLPGGFRRLQKATKELMDEFKVNAGANLEFEFINPSESPDGITRNEVYQQLAMDGHIYFNVQVEDRDGGTSTIPVFPSAMVSFRAHGQQLDRPVNLFQGSSTGQVNDAIINRAVENLEYEFVSAMRVVTREMVPSVAMLQGHGELDELESLSLFNALSMFYRVERVNMNMQLNSLADFDAILVADPDSSFPERDKFIIDQFIMHGGKALWCVDAVKVQMNELADSNEIMSRSNAINIGDMLFDYGVKINSSLIQDLQCAFIPVYPDDGAGVTLEQQMVPFFYLPLITPRQDNPITRNLNMLKMDFVSPIDTIGDNPNIRKTVLLNSSNRSRILRQPVRVALDVFSEKPDVSRFPMENLPVAVLLEGKFPSFYQNRLPEQWVNNELYEVLDESKVATKMIVISDGDIARNFVSYQNGQAQANRLGWDRYMGQMFGNKDFLLNCMNYLLDDEGVMGVRSREVQLRLMQYEEITDHRLKWQLINVIIPVALAMFFGILYTWRRRKKYGRKI